MTNRLGGAGDGPAGDGGASGLAHHVTDEVIAAYADREVEASVALEVERHLVGCATCQASLRVQRTVRDRLEQEAVPEDVSAALRDRIFAAVLGAEPAPGRASQARPSPRGWSPAALIAAVAMRPAWAMSAVLAAALVMTLWVGSSRGRAPMPDDSAGTVAGESSDTAAIMGLIMGHAAAWNERNPEAVVALLTDDAVWVTSGGEEFHGPEAIKEAHVEWLAQDSLAGGTTHVHPPGSITIRFLREDVAVADLEGAFRGLGAADGQDVPEELARIFVVATKEGDTWRIAQLRNMRRQLGTTGR